MVAVIRSISLIMLVVVIVRVLVVVDDDCYYDVYGSIRIVDL